MKTLTRCFAILAACGLLLTGTTAQAVLINWVPVGNPGNAGEVQSQGTFGAVSDSYRIGKYEVTNNQYAEFLNAKAATNGDALQLYFSQMGIVAVGGITRNGSGTVLDPYVYTVKPGHGNNPVVYVDWVDAVRFANWMHSGQGSGDTESGAYTLLGGTPIPSNIATVARNRGAQIFLPSEDEWYKAAYHKNDGVTGNYWDYPTSTDAQPYSDQPPGSDAPTQSNTANFFWEDGIANGYDDGYAVDGSAGPQSNAKNYLTDVGAYTLSVGPYGTFDQAGNVHEWNETLIVGIERGLRGGSFSDSRGVLRASFRDDIDPTNERNNAGFRLASVFSEAELIAALQADPPSGSTINFGTLAPSTTGLFDDVTLANIGDDGSEINVSSFFLGGMDPSLFDVSGFLAAMLDPAGVASVDYNVDFLGSAIPGSYAATLTFVTDAPEGNVVYNLTATVQAAEAAVPEPSTLVLGVIGAVVLVMLGKQRARKCIL